ncbi:MAG: hypothetical protein VKJ02_12215 [Snowella sp.]|nr:hypothetical protein [Snowella sp.]
MQPLTEVGEEPDEERLLEMSDLPELEKALTRDYSDWEKSSSLYSDW